jgi:hypothetical protein
MRAYPPVSAVLAHALLSSLHAVMCVCYVSGVLCQSVHDEHIPLFLQCSTQNLYLNATPLTHLHPNPHKLWIDIYFCNISGTPPPPLPTPKLPQFGLPRLPPRTHSTCNTHVCYVIQYANGLGKPGAGRTERSRPCPRLGKPGAGRKEQRRPRPQLRKPGAGRTERRRPHRRLRSLGEGQKDRKRPHRRLTAVPAASLPQQRRCDSGASNSSGDDGDDEYRNVKTRCSISVLFSNETPSDPLTDLASPSGLGVPFPFGFLPWP